MDFSFLIGPLVGSVIGYITNDIAIRMLFRPHKAKYIFGIHVPFTPGIIPKEKHRIASSVGETISENLINKDVLSKNLLSEDMMHTLSDSYDTYVSNLASREDTLEEYATQYISKDELESMRKSTSEELTRLIYTRLSETTFGNKIATIIVDKVVDKMDSGLTGILGAGKIATLLRQPTEAMLSKQINEIISANSEKIVSDLINKESHELLSTSLKTLLSDKQQQIAQAKEALMSAYTTIITTHLPKMLSTLNISKIIEDRINEMDMNEAEGIILGVIDKELKAIVWFGALLGCIMGIVTSLV